MNTNFIFKHFHTSKNIGIYFFALIWLLGLISGCLLASNDLQNSKVVLHAALLKNTGTPFTFIIFAFSLLAFVISLRYSLYLLSYWLLFIRALCCGFCGMLLFFVFGSGAWLIRMLLFFSGNCVSVLMWWFLLQNSNNKTTQSAADIWLVSILSIVVAFVDISVISPFLANLTQYF